jgi:hypothetical protein
MLYNDALISEHDAPKKISETIADKINYKHLGNLLVGI